MARDKRMVWGRMTDDCMLTGPRLDSNEAMTGCKWSHDWMTISWLVLIMSKTIFRSYDWATNMPSLPTFPPIVKQSPMCASSIRDQIWWKLKGLCHALLRAWLWPREKTTDNIFWSHYTWCAVSAGCPATGTTTSERYSTLIRSESQVSWLVHYDSNMMTGCGDKGS